MKAEETLRTLIERISKERNYENYTVTIKPINSGGANYSSHLFTATLSTADKDDLDLFAKVVAAEKELRDSIPRNFFTKEPHFYMSVLKYYRQIEDKYNIINENRLVTPKFYAAGLEYMHESLVLENLNAKGFVSFNRFQSIDWAYTCHCLKQIAIFHALSVAYSKEYPKEFETTVKKEFSLYPGDLMTSTIEKAFDQALRSVKEENKQRLTEWLQNPKIRRPVHELFKPTEIPVIIHGDFRPNNMMHKIQNDGTLQVITLDYQTLQQGYPAVDVMYFLLLGSDKQFRHQYLQQSFDFYYQSFSDALQRFNLDSNEIYSKSTYQQDLKELLPYMLSFSLFLILLITVDENDAPNFDDGLTMDKMDVSPNKLYAERINDLIDDFIDMGML